jgi:Zn-dependent M28 family amino/carboxypeptidase
MHALNILANAGYQGKYPIEVHAYAGEEGGLLGSAKLAQSYKNNGVVLRGMLNLEVRERVVFVFLMCSHVRIASHRRAFLVYSADAVVVFH